MDFSGLEATLAANGIDPHALRTEMQRNINGLAGEIKSGLGQLIEMIEPDDKRPSITASATPQVMGLQFDANGLPLDEEPKVEAGLSPQALYEQHMQVSLEARGIDTSRMSAGDMSKAMEIPIQQASVINKDGFGAGIVAMLDRFFEKAPDAALDEHRATNPELYASLTPSAETVGRFTPDAGSAKGQSKEAEMSI